MLPAPGHEQTESPFREVRGKLCDPIGWEVKNPRRSTARGSRLGYRPGQGAPLLSRLLTLGCVPIQASSGAHGWAPPPAAHRRRRCEVPGGPGRGAAPPARQCAPGSLAVVSAFLRAGPVSKAPSWGPPFPILYSSWGHENRIHGWSCSASLIEHEFKEQIFIWALILKM